MQFIELNSLARVVIFYIEKKKESHWIPNLIPVPFEFIIYRQTEWTRKNVQIYGKFRFHCIV